MAGFALFASEFFLKDGDRIVMMDMVEYAEMALAHGINLASSALKAGPVAAQIKGIVNAVCDTNSYFLVISMAGMPRYEETIRKSQVIQPHMVELVPATAAAESFPGSSRE